MMILDGMITELGAVAQLGERVVRNDEVRGSIPRSSTKRYDRQNRWIVRSSGSCFRQVILDCHSSTFDLDPLDE